MGQKPKQLDPGRSDAHQWGADVRRRRDELGLSLAKIADRVGYSASTVRHVEHGRRRPPPGLVAALDDALAASGELIRSHARISYGDAYTLDASEPLPTAAATPTVDVVDRRQFIIGGALTAVAMSTPAQSIGTDHIDTISKVTAKLWSIDNEHGSGGLLDEALTQYRQARQWFDHGDYGWRIGRDLGAATGRLGCQAAWFSFDSGQPEQAQAIYFDALATATRIDDADLLADVLSGLYFLSTNTGKRQEAVQFGARVADLRKRYPSNRMHALMSAREAEACAGVGDQAGYERNLANAWREADKGLGPVADDPLWSAFVTESELLSLEAKGARYLGDHSVALDRLRRAVELTCTPRDEASYRAYLSATAVDAGEYELAVDEGVRALDLLKSVVASPRLVGGLASTRRIADGPFAARFDTLARVGRAFHDSQRQ